MIQRTWTVEMTAAFAAWYGACSPAQRAALDVRIGMLEAAGPHLGHPYSSAIRGSRHGHLRELRLRHAGRLLRAFYALDPRRHAILLAGGDKTGDSRFYERLIRVADREYDLHIAGLRRGGA